MELITLIKYCLSVLCAGEVLKADHVSVCMRVSMSMCVPSG